VSRICEEFGCTPSQALREVRRHRHLVEAILDLRAYHRAYVRVETARDDEEVERTAYVDLVFRHAYERQQAKVAARRARQE